MIYSENGLADVCFIPTLNNYTKMLMLQCSLAALLTSCLDIRLL